MSPFTTDKSLTLAGVAWMFTCAPSDAAIARTLVDAVLAAPRWPETGTPAFRRSAMGRVHARQSVLRRDGFPLVGSPVRRLPPPIRNRNPKLEAQTTPSPPLHHRPGRA
ncbi:MAG: hypothetical protein IPL39_17660 [Opitutaceae bacterium]|nr:hypothetical protein [Opitutaceae bacterium]